MCWEGVIVCYHNDVAVVFIPACERRASHTKRGWVRKITILHDAPGSAWQSVQDVIMVEEVAFDLCHPAVDGVLGSAPPARRFIILRPAGCRA